jgi:hypothetical protein
MKHLNDFVDEVNMIETRFGKDIEVGIGKDRKEVIDLLRP